MPTLIRIALLTLLTAVLLSPSLRAADYKVDKTEGGPPSEELAPAIVQMLEPSGVKVIRGTSTTFAELWLVKELAVSSLDTPLDIIYPFQPGQLVGVVKLSRSASDFRDQDIEKGVYTLRYAQQPVDGAHVGTSPTRDFLLLVPAKQDKSPEPIDYQPLVEQSAEVAGASHPALLSLQRIFGEPGEIPTVREDDQHGWWILRVQTQVKAGDQTKQLPIDIVVEGQAEAV